MTAPNTKRFTIIEFHKQRQQCKNHSAAQNVHDLTPKDMVVRVQRSMRNSSLWKLSSTVKTTVLLLQMSLLPIQVIETLEGRLIPSPWRQRLWTYQQNSTLAHKAKSVQQWSHANMPDFIDSSQWPPIPPI
ncbi:hypothetical protein WR25_10287 [Diploscapter pachys]|uniref:Uncharacterized protein n=1 Tax=Diploscapter pachys TaxID=2018661 RepID=A0A2A2JEM7_9BILA|nr:hypothetical protein WR25_10287 [Diploscapter pachys]